MAKLLETIDLVTNFYTYEGVVKALDRVSLSICLLYTSDAADDLYTV